jgi:hypothetical protein
LILPADRYAGYPGLKRSGSITALLVLLFLAAGFYCPAQNSNKLPDSVSTETESISEQPLDAAPAPPVDAPRKDSETITHDTVLFRKVPDTEINRYKKDKDFAYANDPAYWVQEPPDNSSGFWIFLARLLASRAFRLFVYIFLGLVLLFALYKIISENKLYLFYRSPKKKIAGPQAIVGLQEENLEEKIQEAVQARDYRTATRYLFLKTLRLLSEEESIRYHVQATNQEYINQLGSHPQGKNFRLLASAYEHVWYGDFPLTQQQFEQLWQHFREFYKAMAPSP